MNLPVLTRVRGRHERREAAGAIEAERFVTALRDTARDNHALERLADTDVRRYYTLPPTPRPYIRERCWCGQGYRWHLPDYVTEALRHGTVAETVDADSMILPAVRDA